MRRFLVVVCFIYVAHSCRERPTTVQPAVCPTVEHAEAPKNIPFGGISVTPKIETNATTSIVGCPAPSGYVAFPIFVVDRYVNGSFDGSYTNTINGKTIPEMINDTDYVFSCNRDLHLFGVIHTKRYETEYNNETSFIGIKKVWCLSFNQSNDEDNMKLIEWLREELQPTPSVCEPLPKTVSQKTNNTVPSTPIIISNSSQLTSIECAKVPGYESTLSIFEESAYVNGRLVKSYFLTGHREKFEAGYRCARSYNISGYGYYSDQLLGYAVFTTNIYCHRFNLNEEITFSTVIEELGAVYNTQFSDW